MVLSAALWLGHQLNVAYGLEEVELERAPFVDLPLRKLPTSVRRSKFAFDGASDRLWTPNAEPSGARRWIDDRLSGFGASESVQASRWIYVQRSARNVHARSPSRWNSKHGNDTEKRLGYGCR